MGNAGGKTKTQNIYEQINNQMVSVTQQVVNSCSATTNQEVLVNLSGNMGIIDMSGTTIKQNTAVNVNCALSNINRSDITNKLATILEQTAESKGSLAPFGNTKAEARTTIQNTVSVAVNTLTANQVAAMVSQKVGIDAQNNRGVIVLKNITIDQSAKAVAQSMVDVVNQTGVTQAVANTVKQRSEAEGGTLGGTLFGGLFDDISQMVIVFVLLVGLIIGGILLYYLISSGAGTSSGGHMFDIFIPFSQYMS